MWMLIISKILLVRIKFNSEKIIEIFKGKDNDFSKAVCLNAAAGLIVSGKYEDYGKAYNIARDFIKSGSAHDHLTKIQNGWKYSWKNNQKKNY